MASEQLTTNEEYLVHAREIFIHVGFLTLLVAACFLILRPLLPVITWGIIIAIAVYPGYRKLQTFSRGNRIVAAVVCTVLLLAILILPVVLLTGTLVEGVQTLAARLKGGTQIIPPPPPSVEQWPIIGTRLRDAWALASVNLSAALKTFTPQIKTVIPSLLSASAGIGMAGLQVAVSILIAGVLLAKSAIASQMVHSLTNRLFGEKGPQFAHLAESTIRSVTTGIIGVALIQSVLAGVGFLVFGLPGAGLWAVIFLFAAIFQVGALTLIPAVIYMFTIASTTKSVMFLIWCAVVGVMDNFLKPVLLGRGVEVPIAVVFLGAIGGFLAIGIMGLFLGSIVLSVGYKLFLGWLERPAEKAA